MRAILVLAALIVAVPAVAGAQDATERRRQQMDENFRQLEQNQRIGEVERQLSNMEIRRQSDEALRSLQQPPVVTNDNPYEVERQLSNMEIRRQSDEALRSLQQPPVVTNDNPYTVPATAVLPGPVSADDVARDSELAASNARLRALSKAQRGQ
jgi:hypothetical protein